MAKKRSLIGGLLLSVGGVSIALAAIANSAFTIPSLRLGGAGGKATSKSFQTSAHLGGPAVGAASSKNFSLRGGFISQTLSIPSVTAKTFVETKVNPNQDNVVTLNFPFGRVTLNIPKNTFPRTANLKVKLPTVIPPPRSNVASFSGTGVGIEITTDENFQPQKTITLTLGYRDADVEGRTENRLRLAFYSEEEDRWILIPSTIDELTNTIEGQVNHFTLFQILEMVPAVNLSNALVFPNPYRPSLGHTQVNITNLPADTKIKIFTILGQLVQELVTDSVGQAIWDARNQDGDSVSSGLYLAFVEKDNSNKVLKLAVER